MQLNTDAEKGCRVGVDEKLIHFKPSPNFKNMKKFLKSRMGDDPFDSPVMESPESSPRQEESQPPLPLDPPPPDEPPKAVLFPSPMNEQKEEKIFLTIPKQECASPEPEIKIEEQVPLAEEIKVPKPICKDFIRGSCSRVGCRYRHEIDLTQLRGIFIFCHNFQNSVCDRPNCRFVHATVFEEQRFYRTGELPKVLMHKPEAQIMPPPPPPPPPTTESEPCTDVANNNPFMPNVSKPPPQISAKPEEQLLNGLFNLGADLNKSPVKRGWLENEEGRTELMNSASLQDDEPRSKRNNEGRCGSCKVMEHRWKFAVKKLDEIMKSASESEMKLSKLQRKHKYLVQIAWAISQASKKRDHVNAGQHIPTNVDQILQQMATLSDCLAQIKDDERRNSSTTIFASQLKQLVQGQANINKINNIDENGTKAYQLSAQQLVQQLEAPSSSISSYQLQTGANNTAPNEQSSVRLASMGSSRQLSNLLNSW